MKSEKERNNRVLIITSSGGGGLLQAAKAKEQEVRRINPKATIIKKDMLKEWVWKKIGNFGVNMWDKAQRRGKVRKLEWILRQQKYAEILFWPSIFFRVLSYLFRERIDRLIDTQVMGTYAILKAIRIYNHFRKKDVYLEKVIVDLPTKKASHFFEAMKKLSKKDLEHLRIVTIKPLLENEETADDFWMKYTGLKEADVYYEDHFIRESFHQYIGKKPKQAPCPLKIRTKNLEEKKFIRKAAQKGAIEFQEGKDYIDFSIGKKDKLFTILLGSQPAFDATVSYVKKIISMAKKYPFKDKHFHVFVFCSNHEPNTESLLKKVHDTVIRSRNFPEHLSIIPVSFQNEDVIATLFHRSNLTCTRSGGQTSMELLNVMNGQIWIHSEAKMIENKKDLSVDELLKGIPGWEAGNACYLIEYKGAKLVTPFFFEEHLEKFLKKC